MYYENCASLASLLHHILICLEATSRGTARAPTGEGARAGKPYPEGNLARASYPLYTVQVASYRLDLLGLKDVCAVVQV